MKIGNIRGSRLARAKLNLSSWSGRANWSPAPITRRVLISFEPEVGFHVRLSSAKSTVPDRIFPSLKTASVYAAGLSLEYGAEISNV